MQQLFQRIAALGHWAYLIEGLLIFAEDALFFGFVLPAETVLALCGFLAHQRALDPLTVALVAMGTAILGDQTGFEIGAHFGEPIKRSRLGRRIAPRHWEAAEALLKERGGPAVFVGRWTAFLRALVPTTSGLLHMPRLTFSAWNAFGGIAWAIVWTAVGYAAGASWAQAAKRFGEIEAAVAIVLVGAAIVTWLRRRRHAER